jgi:GTPase SAR1 family protein
MLAKYNNLNYFEISAKTGENVKQVFEYLAKILLEKHKKRIIEE